MNLNEGQTKKKRKNVIFSFKLFPYDFVKWTAAIPTLIALRPRAYYVSKKARKKIKGANIVIANHESFIDPINVHLAVWHRRIHMLATTDLFSTKKAERFFTLMQCIPVNKKNFNYSTFKQVEYWLDRNSVVAIFPEGTVNANKDLTNTFHSGVVLMALKCKVPIVPLYIKRREHWYERLRYVFGEPIYLEDLFNGIPNINDLNNVTEMLHNTEVNLKTFLDNKLRKKEK